jgi:hypothetical protein
MENETAVSPYIGWLIHYGMYLEQADNDPEDGRVTLHEANQYTSQRVETDPDRETPQHPLIDDNGDEIGHYFTSDGYDIEDDEKDGFVAARIFNLDFEVDLPEDETSVEYLEETQSQTVAGQTQTTVYGESTQNILLQ